NGDTVREPPGKVGGYGSKQEHGATPGFAGGFLHHRALTLSATDALRVREITSPATRALSSRRCTDPASSPLQLPRRPGRARAALAHRCAARPAPWPSAARDR